MQKIKTYENFYRDFMNNHYKQQITYSGDINKDIFIYVSNGDIDKVKNNIDKVDINRVAPQDIRIGCKDEKNSLLLVAIRNNHFEMIKLLLENGADVNLGLSNGIKVIQYVEKNEYYTEIMDILIKYGGDINDKSDKRHGNRSLILGEIQLSICDIDEEGGEYEYAAITYLLEHNCIIEEEDIDEVVKRLRSRGWSPENYYRSKFKNFVTYKVFTDPEYQSIIIDNNNNLYNKLREVGLLKEEIKKKYPHLEDRYQMLIDVDKYNL